MARIKGCLYENGFKLFMRFGFTFTQQQHFGGLKTLFFLSERIWQQNC